MCIVRIHAPQSQLSLFAPLATTRPVSTTTCLSRPHSMLHAEGETRSSMISRLSSYYARLSSRGKGEDKGGERIRQKFLKFWRRAMAHVSMAPSFVLWRAQRLEVGARTVVQHQYRALDDLSSNKGLTFELKGWFEIAAKLVSPARPIFDPDAALASTSLKLYLQHVHWRRV